MPGKHVHFSRSHNYHSPQMPGPYSPNLPVPGLSHASLGTSPASSYGPLTPPSHPVRIPGPSPYSAVPYPAPILKKPQGPPRAHALLEYSTSPSINYDMRTPPSSVSTSRRTLPSYSLSDPAINPPLSSLTLTTPYLPWPIHIMSSHRHGYITVKDVLDEIYYTLRTNMTGSEFNSLLSSTSDQRRVVKAYEQRYRRIRDLGEYEEEKRKGVKRVDFLMERTKFAGISSTRRADAWILHVR